jgi:hypothetical protein
MNKNAVAAVDAHPVVTLVRWGIRETSSGRQYFVGYCLENREYRVSTAIESFNRRTGIGVTASGRRYLLVGSPCIDREARLTWQELAVPRGIGESKDVSTEFTAK